jgi:hypothetical protein
VSQERLVALATTRFEHEVAPKPPNVTATITPWVNPVPETVMDCPPLTDTDVGEILESVGGAVMKTFGFSDADVEESAPEPRT